MDSPIEQLTFLLFHPGAEMSRRCSPVPSGFLIQVKRRTRNNSEPKLGSRGRRWIVRQGHVGNPYADRRVTPTAASPVGVHAEKLAARKAQNSAVKDFAHVMVTDHDKANEQLATAAAANGLPKAAKPDVDHRVMMEQLDKADDKAFDTLYIRGQVVEHQKAAQLYEWIIDSGQDPRLTRYAMDTLPIVLHHLEMAQGVLAQLAGAAP